MLQHWLKAATSNMTMVTRHLPGPLRKNDGKGKEDVTNMAKVVIGVLVALILVLVLVPAVLAGNGGQYSGNGQPSDGAGPGLQNQWGMGIGGNGAGYGEASDCTGPDLQNQWGKQ